MQVAGPAFTIRREQVDRAPEEPYAELLAAYRHMRPREVIVMEAAEPTSAVWGELLSTAAAAQGVTGAVMDGAARDIAQIVAIGFPVLAAGATSLDSAGRREAVAYQTTIRCGDATGRPGRHGIL